MASTLYYAMPDDEILMDRGDGIEYDVLLLYPERSGRFAFD